VLTCPPSDGDFTSFKPEFGRYQVIVSNLDSPDWPADLRTAFEQYVSGGGGLVVVHAADNAFSQLAGIQRDDRHRRLAQPDGEGRTPVVLRGRQAGL